MSYGQALLTFFIIFLCTYILISRICKCIESCALARAFWKASISNPQTVQEFKKFYEHYKQTKNSEKPAETVQKE